MSQNRYRAFVLQVFGCSLLMVNLEQTALAEMIATDVPAVVAGHPLVDMIGEAEPSQTVVASIPLKVMGNRVGETRINLRILGTQTTLLRLAVDPETSRGSTAYLWEQGRVGVVRHGQLGNPEGELRLNIVLQTPANWRAELLQLTVETDVAKSRHSISTSYPIAIFRLHDLQARLAAEEFASATRQLSDRATQHRRSIRKRAEPSIFHRLGNAIDVIEPRIADDWYTRVLFQTVDVHHDPKFVTLPADVKVAILDYQAARRKLWEQPRRHETLVTKRP
jgi:hypothetical protein